MLIVGESVYKDCMVPDVTSMPGTPLACPFKQPPVPLEHWCARCHVAKIRSLQRAVRGIGAEAERVGSSQY